MAATSNTTKNNISIPNWKISGDFFDVCNCNMPCPCEFAQAPTYDDCEGVLVWHIRKDQTSKHISFGWSGP